MATTLCAICVYRSTFTAINKQIISLLMFISNGLNVLNDRVFGLERLTTCMFNI